MYLGINHHGGPCNYGNPEHMFGSTDNTQLEIIYLRGGLIIGMKKVGHLTVEEWNKKVEDVREELGGK